jgi:hypothetical protein
MVKDRLTTRIFAKISGAIWTAPLEQKLLSPFATGHATLGQNAPTGRLPIDHPDISADG